MSDSNSIQVGQFDEFIWARCNGKGSFSNSPHMKHWIDDKLSAGQSHLVIDLEACTAMDSTFMGTLAGAAMKLTSSGGKFEIAGADAKSITSLDDLGLSSIMNINPSNPIWANTVEEIRANLSSPTQSTRDDSTQHVFDAHKKLCEADSNNNDKFSTVLDCLEAELASRSKGSM